MSHCYDCGLLAPLADGVPTCPAHGPRWKLVRNVPAADVLIVDGDRVLLSRRAIEPFRGCWELPGGIQHLGELPAEAARREVAEELGVAVRLTGLLGIYLDPFEDGFGQATVFIGDIAGQPVGGDHESLEWRWFAPDELPPDDELAFTHGRRLRDWRAGAGSAQGGPVIGLDGA